MALKIPQQDGRIVQATEVPKTGMGTDIARPLETQKVGRASFGDYSGDMEMAQVVKQVGSMAEDFGKKMLNLKVAEENDQLQRMMEEIDTAEKQSQIESKSAALEQGVSVEEMAAMYQTRREEAVMGIKDKYKFETMVGNDVDQRLANLSDRYNTDYEARVVMPARVEKVKAGQVETIKEMQKNLSLGMSMYDNPIDQAAELKSYVEKVSAFTSNPAVVAVFGDVGAMDLRERAITDATRDAVTEMVIKDPELMVNLLGTPTGDPATDAFFGMDPSLRKTLLNTATSHRNTVRAEEKRLVREQQDEVQAQLSMAIARRDPEMMGPQGMNKIAKLIQDNVIADRNGAALYSQIATIQRQKEEDAQRAADRRVRQQEIAARKQEKAQEKRDDLVDRAFSGDKGAANRLWVQEESRIAALPAAQQIKATMEFVQGTGVIPRGVESDISRNIFSTDKKLSEGAIAMAKRLKEDAPVAYEQMDQWIKARVSLGERHPPEQANKIIEANRRMTKDQHTAVKAMVDSQMKSTPPSTVLADLFDTKPGVIPPALGGEYKSRVAELALITSDIPTAQKMAAEELRAKGWGVTSVGGRDKMQYKPIEVQTVNEYKGDPEAAVEHFETEIVKPHNLPKGKYTTQWVGTNEATGKDVWLVVNTDTMQAYKDSTGQPLAWEADYSTSPAAQRATAAGAKEQKKAKWEQFKDDQAASKSEKQRTRNLREFYNANR